jgi:HD-like signal output (HDOD) protein/CheY-like chemotaxis protein
MTGDHDKKVQPGGTRRPRVLFVDDQTVVLKAIRKEMEGSDFDVYLARGAGDGLKILDKMRVEILVTDFIMPDMDGIDFLQAVKEKYPHIHRIVLSGCVEDSSVMNGIRKGYATAYFSKPWEKGALKQTITHFLKRRRKLKFEKISRMLEEITELPGLPSTYQEFVDAVSKDKQAGEISKIINKDVALTARILHLANSAFYGSVNISTVESAIMRLGLNAVKDIIFTFSFISELDWQPDQLEMLQAIIRHSILVNKFIKKVYFLKHGETLRQEYISVGITHDIGKIVLLQYFRDRYQSILDYMENHPGTGFMEGELAMGFERQTHAEIGACFLDLWHLPDFMVDTALYHHEKGKGDQPYNRVVEALHFTDRILESLETASDSADVDLPGILQGYLTDKAAGELGPEMISELQGQCVDQG